MLSQGYSGTLINNNTMTAKEESNIMSINNNKVSDSSNLLMLNEKENCLRNNEHFKKSSGFLKEFYNLLFKGIQTRIAFIMKENEEMKDCIRSLINELMNMVEFKLKSSLKLLNWDAENIFSNQKNNNKTQNLNYNSSNLNENLNKLNFEYPLINKEANQNKENLNNENNPNTPNTDYEIDVNHKEYILGSFRNYNFINEKKKLKNLLELNKEDFGLNLDALLKKFRACYLYDTLKINPSEEFSFSYSQNEKENEIIDNKPFIASMPFYKEIIEFFRFFEKENLTEVIKNIENVIKEVEKYTKNINIIHNNNLNIGHCSDNYTDKISFNRDVALNSHKSNYNNEDFMFNNHGSFASNPIKDNIQTNLNSNNNNNNNQENTIKISLRDDIDKDKLNNFILNSYKACTNSDFNNENLNTNLNYVFNNNFIKLEDKIHKINTDIRLKIEDLENKLIEIDGI